MTGLHLYTASTMNGWKPLILLEELGVAYALTHIRFDQNEQKQDWYLKLNPNGRIPTLVDHSNDGFVVFESAAILWYLAEKFDRFLPTQANHRSEAMQWLFFQMSGIGPMMGQAMYFQRIAAPQGITADFATQRYVAESRRLLEVLNRRLTGRTWVVGEQYSIVDMAMYPYVRAYPWAKVSVTGLSHLNSWLQRMEERPAVTKALTLPEPFPAFFSEQEDADAVTQNASRFTLPTTPNTPVRS